MAKIKYCQSCGIPLKDVKLGTEKDGTDIEKYCYHCFQEGDWTLDLPFDEMYEHNLKQFENSKMNKFKKALISKMYTKKFMRSLERWQITR